MNIRWVTALAFCAAFSAVAAIKSEDPKPKPTPEPKPKQEEKRAEKPDAPKPKPGDIETKAEAVLRSHADFYRKLETAETKVRAVMRVEGEGVTQEIRADFSFAFQRANKIAAKITDGILGASLVCDGKELHTYVPALKKHTSRPAPENLDAVGDNFGDFQLLGMPLITLVEMFKTDPFERAMAGVLTLQDKGVEEIDGVRCHRLRATQEQFDWDMWCVEGERPTMRRVVFDLTKLLKAEAEDKGGGDISGKLTVDYGDWRTGHEIPADTFKFSPPSGSEKVTEFFPGANAAEDETPSLLLGKPAPPFKAKTLGGEEVALAKFKGDKAVVLTFWTVWSAPAAAAVPRVAEIVGQHSGAVFYAVNVEDDPRLVEALMKRANFKGDVLLDASGRIGQLYGVENIPLTVVIDKEGIVRWARAGNLKKLPELLGAEIEKATKSK